MERHEDITIYGNNRIYYSNPEKITIKNKQQEIIKYIEIKNISPFIKMYKEFLFDGGEAGFERNLTSSISLMRVLSQAITNNNSIVEVN
ncbi:hypothetical protein [Pantoea sp. Mhis]|uniref:hypothetical protein n=1 Tax=Pantoea sp. Mhis TaxID=2576759 RepID=UPI00135A2CC3|nr:hypothetical protein [Pantoea sp. Mhis]MXP56788.1 hypothetical protein [Pantoea sp. Mhis]